MRSRLPFPRPRRADGTILLATFAGVLAAMLVLQLAVPRALPLPEPATVRPFVLPSARIVALVADPAILARPLFGGSVAGAAADAPIDGAVAIGVMSRAGLRTAFVQGADGQVASLRPGDVFRGWRLRAIDRDALVFDQAGRTVSLPVTAHAAAPASEIQAPATGASLPHPLD